MDIESWYSKGNTFVSGEIPLFFMFEKEKEFPLFVFMDFRHLLGILLLFYRSSSPRFDCIVPDLVGLGVSKSPLKKDIIMSQADAIEVLVEALGISEAHIFAHDVGGYSCTGIIGSKNWKTNLR